MTSGVGVVGGFLHDDDFVDDRKRTNNTIYPRNNTNDDAATANRSCNNNNINLMHQQLMRAIARGNLQSVRRIVESVSLSEDDDDEQRHQKQRRMLINHAEIWTETPPSSSSVGKKYDYGRAVRPREATTTRTTTESGGGIQLGELGYTFRKQFAAGWFTGTVVRMILPLAHTRASIATNENDTTTKEEDGGSEGGGIVKKHDDYYRRCVYTDGDSEDLTVDDIIQLFKADPNNNKSRSSNNSHDTTTNVVKEEKAKDEGTNNNNDNNGLVMSSSNNNNTSSTSSTVIQHLEWYDITPLTLAVMRGHDDIVEYLLRLGADPTLMGYPKNQPQHPDSNNNNKAHNNIMDAYIAASRLCKMIRRCRRTQDLLLSVKPFWKKASYYGSSVTSASAAVTSSTTTSSSNNNKLRTEYTNVPIHTTWMLRAIDQVPRMVDYPLLCLNYDESMFDVTYWKTKMCDYTKVIKDNKLSSISSTSMNNNNWVEVGQSRRCSSCREYKPVQSYYKNEKKKGTLARCISCVATNPETLDLLQLHDNNNNNKSSSYYHQYQHHMQHL